MCSAKKLFSLTGKVYEYLRVFLIMTDYEFPKSNLRESFANTSFMSAMPNMIGEDLQSFIEPLIACHNISFQSAQVVKYLLRVWMREEELCTMEAI